MVQYGTERALEFTDVTMKGKLQLDFDLTGTSVDQDGKHRDPTTWTGMLQWRSGRAHPGGSDCRRRQGDHTDSVPSSETSVTVPNINDRQTTIGAPSGIH